MWSHGRQSIWDVCKLVINVIFILLWAWSESWWPDPSTAIYLFIPLVASLTFSSIYSSKSSVHTDLCFPFLFFSSVGPSLGKPFLFKLGSSIFFFNSFLNCADKFTPVAGLLCYGVLSTCRSLWPHIFPQNVWRFIIAKKEKEQKRSPFHPPQ